MDFKQFVAIVRSRILLLLIVFLLTVATSAVLTYVAPKRYTASTYLLLSFKEESPFETTVIPAQLAAGYLKTQLDIIRSQNVALKVAQELKLDRDLRWINAHKQTAAKDIPLLSWIAVQVSSNLAVDSLPNSHVVNLTYESGSSTDAARIANAFARAFFATTLELTVEKAKRNSLWFDEQLQVLRKRLESARAHMTQFQVENGIVALDEKLAAENTLLIDISKGLVEAQSALYNARSRQLGTNHPAYVRALQHEVAVNKAMQEQKRDILQLKRLRDQLDALANEVESERRNYLVVLQSYYKESMKSQLNHGSVSVLSEALPPQSASSPNLALNMASAVVLGFILGLVVIVAAEMVSPQIHIAGRSSRPGVLQSRLPS